MPKPKRRVTRDGTPPVHNLSNAVGRHPDLTRQFGRAHSKLAKLLSEMLPRMYCCASHRSSVIIHKLHITRSLRSLWPFETYSPLIIDPNVILTAAIPFQRLEPVAWKGGYILQRCSRFKLIQLHFGSASEPIECLEPLTICEISRSLVAAAQNHQDRTFRPLYA